MDRSLRAGRQATFAFFALNGFVMGMWIVHIPAVEHRVGISHAVLGWLLLLLGGGAFAGMQLAGPLSDRIGARKVVPASAALCGAAVVLPGLATAPWALGAALLVLGFGNGCLDVSMNTHAVQVERGYGRPIMSAFHAVFSVGGVIAALIGAVTLRWGWGAAATLGGAAVFALAATAVAARGLLGPAAPGAAVAPGAPEAKAAPGADAGFAPGGGGVGGAPADGGEAAPSGLPGAATGGAEPAAVREPAAGGGAAPASGRRKTPPRIWALAALALMLMLSEGVANDWSVLDLRDVLDAPAATAALAYGAFATAMTVGRFLTDRVAARFGAVAVLRYGAGIAAVGLTAAALSPAVPLALVGWTVFGLGLSGCIPQLFSAAGHFDQDAAGANVSRVAGLGYLGMLAGPAVIGPMTHFIPLNVAFFLPVGFCVIACATAGMLDAPEARAERTRARRAASEATGRAADPELLDR